MSLNNTFFLLFSNINNGMLSKKNKIKQFRSKKVAKFLQLLVKIGLVQSFRYDLKNQYIYIYLKNTTPFFLKLYYISKPSKRIYINKKNLLKKPGLYILSTNQGFLTNFSISNMIIGGELMCQIK